MCVTGVIGWKCLVNQISCFSWKETCQSPQIYEKVLGGNNKFLKPMKDNRSLESQILQILSERMQNHRRDFPGLMDKARKRRRLGEEEKMILSLGIGLRKSYLKP